MDPFVTIVAELQVDMAFQCPSATTDHPPCPIKTGQSSFESEMKIFM